MMDEEMTNDQMRFIKVLASAFMTAVMYFNPLPIVLLLPILFVGFYKIFGIIPE